MILTPPIAQDSWCVS